MWICDKWRTLFRMMKACNCIFRMVAVTIGRGKIYILQSFSVRVENDPDTFLFELILWWICGILARFTACIWLFVVTVVKFYGLWCKVAKIENKWLVCIDMGACDMGIYPGRFTFERSDRLLDMPPSVPSIHQLDFSISNKHDLRGGGMLYIWHFEHLIL